MRIPVLVFTIVSFVAASAVLIGCQSAGTKTGAAGSSEQPHRDYPNRSGGNGGDNGDSDGGGDGDGNGDGNGGSNGGGE